jgi:mannose-6-phosphate isomerase-like protein (cupin superfamily)
MPFVGREKTNSAMIIRPEDASVYNLAGGGEAQLLLTGDKIGGAWWMGRASEDPRFMTQLHYHPKTAEQVYVLEGVLSVYADNAWHELGRGILGELPHGKPHAQGNRSENPVHYPAHPQVLRISSQQWAGS